MTYEPRHADNLSAQVAAKAELDGQLALFDDVGTPDQWERFADEPVEVDPPVPPTAQAADFRAGYLVVIDHNGETSFVTDITKSLSFEREVTSDEIRRTSRDIHDWATAQYLTSFVVDRLSPPEPESRLKKAAKARGLVD